MKSRTPIIIYAIVCLASGALFFSIGRSAARPDLSTKPAPASVAPNVRTPDPVVHFPYLESAADPDLDLRSVDVDLFDRLEEAIANHGLFADQPAPAFLDQLTLEEVRIALGAIPEMPQPARDVFLHALISRWAHFEPVEAFEFALENRYISEITKPVNAIGSAWGKNDPEAAVAWHTEVSQDPTHYMATNKLSKFLTHVFYQWAKRDLPAALAKAAELPGGYYALSNAVTSSELRPPILDAMLNIDDSEVKTNALAAAMKVWAREDPPAAAAWLDHNAIDEPLIVGAVSGTYKERDALANAKWRVSRTKTPEARAETIEQLKKGRWGRSAPEEVVAWLESLDQ